MTSNLLKLSRAYNSFASVLSAKVWTPIPALNRTDADLSIFFVSPNSIIYDAPVLDPLFTATTAESIGPINGQNVTSYTPDRFVYALSCIDQVQFCNPTTDACTPLEAPSSITGDVLETSLLGLNAAQLNTAVHIDLAVLPLNTFEIVNSRGANSLRASETVVEDRNIGLPPTQWMIEVSTWFGISMAKLQQSIVQFATGPDFIPDGTSLILTAPQNKWQQHICNNQKIRSTSGTISFSVLGIAIILIVGTIIIMTNLILDTLTGFVRKHLGWKDYKRLQWILDEKLQLQRLAYEEVGQGQWSGGLDAIPVTVKGDTFGLPADVDKLHPRLGANRSNELKDTAYHNGAGTPESEGLMGGKNGASTTAHAV